MCMCGNVRHVATALITARLITSSLPPLLLLQLSCKNKFPTATPPLISRIQRERKKLKGVTAFSTYSKARMELEKPQGLINLSARSFISLLFEREQIGDELIFFF